MHFVWTFLSYLPPYLLLIDARSFEKNPITHDAALFPSILINLLGIRTLMEVWRRNDDDQMWLYYHWWNCCNKLLLPFGIGSTEERSSLFHLLHIGQDQTTRSGCQDKSEADDLDEAFDTGCSKVGRNCAIRARPGRLAIPPDATRNTEGILPHSRPGSWDSPPNVELYSCGAHFNERHCVGWTYCDVTCIYHRIWNP